MTPPRHVEDLVDELHQVPARPEDLRDALAVLVAQTLHFQELSESEHDVERCAELVAPVCEAQVGSGCTGSEGDAARVQPEEAASAVGVGLGLAENVLGHGRGVVQLPVQR